MFKPDYLIWMDTITKGRYPTFDRSSEKPKNYDFKISNIKYDIGLIISEIKNKFQDLNEK